MKKSTLLALMGAALLITGCNEQPQAQQPVKNTQAQKAQEAANSITFTDNAEIDNIKARIELTSKPGQIGFILLMNEAGQSIMYEGVRGKITSGSKRLTKPYEVRGFSIGGTNGGTAYQTVATPSDEGTWGSSAEYIFYWNTNGEYRQWNGKYLYSDKPFRLRQEPLVITVADPKPAQN